MVKHAVKPRKTIKAKKAKSMKTHHHTDKPAPKDPWQPIDSAPVLTPVRVHTTEGKTVDAILDGHWYVCADGKPVVAQIIHNPTGWMPLSAGKG